MTASVLANAPERCPMAQELNARYSEFHRNARISKRLATKASPPLLVLPHQKWCTARAKVLIVGQETLRWRYDPVEAGLQGTPIENLWQFLRAPNGVEAMWRLYRFYALGRAYPNLNSPFWRGFRILSACISGCEDSALWTNVFKVNVRGSVISNCKVAEIAALSRVQAGLLSHEVRILKPDVVVFLSGPRYDAAICAEFPDLTITQFSRRRPASAIGLLTADGLPAKTVRTFHPEYLQRSGQLDLLSDIGKWATKG